MLTSPLNTAWIGDGGPAQSHGTHNTCKIQSTLHAVCSDQGLAGFLRVFCGVQIVMTATTAVLCYAATPRTPQEHVAASAVS